MITNGGPDNPILLVLPLIDVTDVGAKSKIPVKNVTLFTVPNQMKCPNQKLSPRKIHTAPKSGILLVSWLIGKPEGAQELQGV